MKNKFLLLGLSFFILSCSSDDDSGNAESQMDFFLLADNNFWVYDVENSTPGTNGTDSLYIAGDVTIAGNTYKKFETENPPYGFYSGIVSNNAVRKSGDELLLTGTAAVGFYDDFAFELELTDYTVFKESAGNNDVFASLTGSFEEVYDQYSIVFDYTLTSTGKDMMASYSVNGTTYTNVKPIDIKLELEVSAVVNFQGFEVPVTVMAPQNVLVSTQYYAESIGVVHVVTDFEYELEDLSQYPVQVPFEQSVQIHQEEFLTNYSAD